MARLNEELKCRNFLDCGFFIPCSEISSLLLELLEFSLHKTGRKKFWFSNFIFSFDLFLNYSLYLQSLCPLNFYFYFWMINTIIITIVFTIYITITIWVFVAIIFCLKTICINYVFLEHYCWKWDDENFSCWIVFFVLLFILFVL